jgi:hypothetical protein
MNPYYIEKIVEEKMRQVENNAREYNTANRAAKNSLFSRIPKLKVENKKHNAACCA